MNWIQRDPLPEECENCREGDCYSCDYAGKRWYIEETDQLRIRRKGLIRAIERLQRQVQELDLALLILENRKEK